MKEAIKIKLLLLGIMIVLLSACALGQINEKIIRLDISVKIDNEEINDTSYVLNLFNYSTKKSTNYRIANNFVLYLDYNTKFKISVNHALTNTKTIIIDTEAPIDNWYIITGLELTKHNTTHILAGSIKYDNKYKTFRKFNK